MHRPLIEADTLVGWNFFGMPRVPRATELSENDDAIPNHRRAADFPVPLFLLFQTQEVVSRNGLPAPVFGHGSGEFWLGWERWTKRNCRVDFRSDVVDGANGDFAEAVLAARGMASDAEVTNLAVAVAGLRAHFSTGSSDPERDGLG